MAKIIVVPSPILRQPTRPVTTLDKRVISVLKDMIETIGITKDPEGVGLAAPQIGIPLRIFLARPDTKGPVSIFINPEIVRISQRIQPTGKKGVFEGCLSIPGHYAPVRRAMSVTVKYLTVSNHNNQIPNPNEISKSKNQNPNNWSLDIGHWTLTEKIDTFTGFPAHVIQHEIDHLNGILFIDRVLEQNSKLYKMEGKDWVEVAI